MTRGMIMFAAALAAAGHAAEPTIELSGVLTTDGKTKLALTDKSTGITRWVDAGGEFNGYRVAKYDPRAEAVTLRRAGQELRLPMVAPKTPDNPAPVAGTASRGNPAAGAARTTAPSAPVTPVASTAPSAAAVPPAPAAVLAPEPPATTAAPSSLAPAGSAAITRSVQAGETVESIAKTAGLTTEQLQALNPTMNASSLQAGQVIRIR